MRVIYMLILCVSSSMLLGACTGSIFGGTPDAVKDLDSALTRPASKQEDALMDKCLHHIFNRQKYTFMKHGKYLSNLKFLNAGVACDDDIKIQLSTSGNKYVVHATILSGKEKVHYSMTDSGEVFEHNDIGFTESF